MSASNLGTPFKTLGFCYCQPICYLAIKRTVADRHVLLRII